ncbi:MAG: DUF4835 family protein [Bacteroidales bacterium]
MRKATFILVFLLSLASVGTAQELRCNVQVITNQIQGTNKQKFTTLQRAIYEFMNGRNWTNHVFNNQERIEANIMINLTDEISSDEFRGTIQIQSRRPIYNSSYNTVLFNYMDNNMHFRYVEHETLEFNENQHLSNLTSILAFYAYIIIGLDYDSFSLNGGTEYFQKAETIVSNAQNASERGWKSFESNRNRYWLASNLRDSKFAPVREFNYRYHRLGLDRMSERPAEARAEITESLFLLQKVYREKPDPFMHLLQVVFDAKSDEFINVFSETTPDEARRVTTLLREVDPANTPKYQRIQQ